jgi:hypothetical protein
MNKSDQAMDRAPEEPSSASTAPETSVTTSATTKDVPAFGWSAYAERINGRFAMVGFLAVVLTEALSADTFLHWSGLIP